MTKFFKNDFFILAIIFITVLPFFFLHQGLLLIDTGREFYIPEQISGGGAVLYKNIFNNLCGPFAYLFNSLLFLIFGSKINTLYCAGIINSFFIVSAIYFISKEFTDKHLPLLISLTVMLSLVFGTFLYNSNLPYTFSISYALSAFLISVLFLIKYIKTQTPNFAYISCLFAGLCFANKYEFILYGLILLYGLIFLKPLGGKNFIKALLCLAVFPLICLFVLIFQGLDIQDIKRNIHLLINFYNSPILKVFFLKFGMYFDYKAILFSTLNNGFYSVFAFLPIINFILLISFFKKIYEDKPLFILVLCTLSACLKSFFYLNINHMGAFIFPICLICTISVLQKINFPKNIIKTALVIFLIFFAVNDFNSLQLKNYKLISDKGIIYTYRKDGKTVKNAMDFINQNTKNTDKIVILPEGIIINYLTNRNSDNIYYNLNPMFYEDIFGETEIIKHFEENKPDYFIILPIDNIEYGKSFFGIDYAQNFYEMIKNNYNLISDKNNMKIFAKDNK